jgi:hypothetical protein
MLSSMAFFDFSYPMQFAGTLLVKKIFERSSPELRMALALSASFS